MMVCGLESTGEEAVIDKQNQGYRQEGLKQTTKYLTQDS
jgi:hypothetical protein